MKTFLSSCILLFCVAAFADVSEQEAHDFAVRFVKIWRSDEGSLNSFIASAGDNTNKLIGWSESFRLSETNKDYDINFKKLNVERTFIRDPEPDNPTQVKLTDSSSAKCLVRPEKIAVVYLSDVQKDIRGVLVMPLVSSNGKIMLCPMLDEDMRNKPIKFNDEGIPSQKNLSTVPGVTIVKIADDNNCDGFPWPKPGEEAKRIFETNPQGCTLLRIIHYAADSETWVAGSDRLSPGRFNVHCELLNGESGTANEKLLNVISDVFKINIKIDNGYLWDGYRVTIPNPLPDCFKKSTNSGGSSQMHGPGDYDGYSLDDILSHALYDKPIQLLSTNNTARYDVRFQVWPEAYGEMAALQQLGFDIVRAKIPERTLVISYRK
jgi:hypothetical protein